MTTSSKTGFGLKAVMIPLALATGLLPVFILGIGSGAAVNNLIIRETLTSNRLVVDSVVESLDTFLLTRERILKVLARNLAELPDLRRETVTPMLINTRAPFPTMSRLSMMTPDGTAYAGDSGDGRGESSAIGNNYADRDYFQEVLRTKESVINRQILIGRTSGTPVMIIAVPVIGNDGAVQAVLVSAIETAILQKIAAQFQQGRTGRIFVASSAGVPIAYNRAEQSADFVGFSKMRVWSEVSSKETDAIENYEGSDGKPEVLVYGTVPSAGWKVWSRRDHSEIMESVVGAYRTVGIWAVVAVLAALAVMLILVTVIAAPLNRLRGTVTRISDGELSLRAEEDGLREIAAVARSVNVMAATLEEKIASERTARQTIEETVDHLDSVVARVAQGDLTARTRVLQDGQLARLGEGLDQMTASLQQLVNEIADAVQSVTTSSSEILAATSQQVSATAEEASAVRQTATTVSEVRQTAEASARKTREVAELARSTASTAAEGRRSVEESILSSEEAKRQMESLAVRILEFSEQAQTISEINATVNDLAEQSNLLAVNAGIEAAKAGEAGRGFAVVANAVKDLADRCKDATEQIQQIVKAFQKSAQSAVIAAEQGVKTSESGVTIAQRSGKAIGDLEASVVTASQAAQQILASAEQQETGMDQIAAAMRDIEQASVQTVSATEQVERAATDLNRLAQTLSDMVQRTTKRTTSSNAD